MSEKRSQFRDSARLLHQAVEHHLDEHPSPAELEAYHRGELAEERSEQIAEHLAWCRADAELVRDLDLLAVDPAEPLAAHEVDAAWERFRSGLAKPTEEPTDEPTLELVDARPVLVTGARPTTPRLAYALAASALLAAGLALVWGGIQRQQGAQARAPKANVPRASLFPEGSDRAATKARTPIAFDPATGAAGLTLNPAAHFPPGRYRIRLREADGRLRWESPSLTPTDAGDFALDLQRGFAPPGPYDVEVWPESGALEPAARYRVTLVEAPS